MPTVTYSVPAIHCKHCTRTIELELSLLEGIQFVKGDVSTKKVVITYGAPASDEKIKALLREIQYPAEV